MFRFHSLLNRFWRRKNIEAEKFSTSISFINQIKTLGTVLKQNFQEHSKFNEDHKKQTMLYHKIIQMIQVLSCIPKYKGTTESEKSRGMKQELMSLMEVRMEKNKSHCIC